MEQVCIVCGGPATREARSQVAPQTAWVCGAVHARKWLRSVRNAKRAGKMAPSGEELHEGVPPAPASAEGQRRVEKRQLTFLGGKPVERR